MFALDIGRRQVHHLGVGFGRRESAHEYRGVEEGEGEAEVAPAGHAYGIGLGGDEADLCTGGRTGVLSGWNCTTLNTMH